MKKLSILCLALLTGTLAFAQEKVYLWPKKTGPGSEKVKIEQKVEERGGGDTHDRIVSGITQPYFEVYRPANGSENKKTGILIIPGGAYQRVVLDKEGLHYVKLFTEKGYTCFVLLYRTPNDPHKDRTTVSLADAQRAMRVIRADAAKYGVRENKIGVLGSSAGGHVAASLAVYHAKEVYSQTDKADKGADGKWTSARPDFQILLYPVITMQDGLCHEGSRTNLMGSSPSQSDKDLWSLEKNASSDAPAAWLCAAVNDKSVLPETNLIPYWAALKKAGVKAELHIFPASGHGFGVMGASGTARSWPELSINWLGTYIDK